MSLMSAKEAFNNRTLLLVLFVLTVPCVLYLPLSTYFNVRLFNKLCIQNVDFINLGHLYSVMLYYVKMVDKHIHFSYICIVNCITTTNIQLILCHTTDCINFM